MSDAAFLGKGWAFPPAFGAGGAGVEMVSGAEDIRQSLQILLNTVPGERVMQEAFGCDMQGLLFEELDQGLISTVQRLVEAAIVGYESRVELDRVDVTRGAEAGLILISLHYTVLATNSRANMVFPFYLTEATLLPPG